MLAKLIAWGETRERAIDRLHALLSRTRIGGIHTTVPLGVQICRWQKFREGRFHTGSLEEWLDRSFVPSAPPAIEVRLAGIVARDSLAARTVAAPRAGSAAEGWSRAGRLEATGREP